MRLIIEKHAKGFTVQDHAQSVVSYAELCAFTTLDEAFALICEKMGEGEKEKPVYPEAQRDAWGLAMADATRRQQEAQAAFDRTVVAQFSRALNNAPAEEPVWKRAKVGDWVRLKDATVLEIDVLYPGGSGDEPLCSGLRKDGWRCSFHRQAIMAILPIDPLPFQDDGA